MIDLLTVERNFVIVSSNLTGGPGEKQMPSRNFGDIVREKKY